MTKNAYGYSSRGRASKLEVSGMTDGLILPEQLLRSCSVRFAYLVIAKDTTPPENELFMIKKEFGTKVKLPLASTV
jgi:hypothetical protein